MNRTMSGNRILDQASLRARAAPVLLLLFLAFNAAQGQPAEGGDYDESFAAESPQITWGRGTNTQQGLDDTFFDDTTPTNVTAVVGRKARLPCTVQGTGHREVSWIRRRDIHILTVGVFTYTSDDRFKVYHPEKSRQWILDIDPVTFRDAGVYECQVATAPKISLPVHLKVEAELAHILGPAEAYIKDGETISLTCTVNTHSVNVGPVTWLHDAKVLDYDSERGGVSLETEKTPKKTTSKLYITRAVKTDSGNYTCVPKTAGPATVTIHIVVSSEEPLAVQTINRADTVWSSHISLPHVLFLMALLRTHIGVHLC